MIEKTLQPELITPQEAIELSFKAGTLSSIDRAKPIFKGFQEEARKKDIVNCTLLCVL